MTGKVIEYIEILSYASKRAKAYFGHILGNFRALFLIDQYQ